MYIEAVPNRNSPPAVLLREAFREQGKVRKRTLANLSCLPAEVIEGLRILLKGGVAVPSAEEVFTIERSLPHGHVAAVLGSATACGAPDWFAAAPERPSETAAPAKAPDPDAVRLLLPDAIDEATVLSLAADEASAQASVWVDGGRQDAEGATSPAVRQALDALAGIGRRAGQAAGPSRAIRSR